MLFNKENLFVHLGGLGDVCLSESVLYSLHRCFEEPIAGLGVKRVLDLFGDYFKKVYSVESARWLYFFSDNGPGPIRERIVFVGKDREGVLRRRWQRFSKEPLVFIEMYPEGAFESGFKVEGSKCKEQGLMFKEETLRRTYEKCHDIEFHGQEGATQASDRFSPRSGREGVAPPALLVEGATQAPLIETYQLSQLELYGIEGIRKMPHPRPGKRVILYPEIGYGKRKCDPQIFVALYHTLRSKGVETLFLECPGLDVDLPDRLILPELSQVREFFRGGGVFVSNDSGLAHLAGMCGLTTITVFTDFDAAIWHPRGANISLQQGRDPVDAASLETVILTIIDRISA